MLMQGGRMPSLVECALVFFGVTIIDLDQAKI